VCHKGNGGVRADNLIPEPLERVLKSGLGLGLGLWLLLPGLDILSLNIISTEAFRLYLEPVDPFRFPSPCLLLVDTLGLEQE